MVKDFPTTAAIAYVQNSRKQNAVEIHMLWAGDSRVYLLFPDIGLVQETKDDIEGNADAYENLSSDGALSNVISSDGSYQLHYRRQKIRKGLPFLVFAATDGCFGYLKTPMEFEYTILDSLWCSENPQSFQLKLKEAFADAAGDDFSFTCMSFGFGSFQNIRQGIIPRVCLKENTLMGKKGRIIYGITNQKKLFLVLC